MIDRHGGGPLLLLAWSTRRENFSGSLRLGQIGKDNFSPSI